MEIDIIADIRYGGRIMKEETWLYLLTDDDRFDEVSSNAYKRLIGKDGSVAFPELGGQFIHLAIIHMQHENKETKRVKAIEFRLCKLTPDGSLDPKFRERRMKMEVELASIQPERHTSSKVVDASQKFQERRYNNEFSWTPTVSMVQQLSSLIRDKSKGILATRDIMYQILHLTATA
jgi:hypothetical protein